MSSWQQPRALVEGEWPALRIAINRVFRPGGGDLTSDSPLLFDEANRENLRVIVGGGGNGDGADDGKHPTSDSSADDRGGAAGPGAQIVAHAGFVIREALVFRRRIRVACVGAVFTVSDQRRQGLASRVLADVLVAARRGTDLVLCSGDRDLYRRQGLDPVPPLARFRLPNGGTPAAGIDVRDATLADLDALAALYEAEDVHFIRSADDWRRLWAAGLVVDAPATFSVVLRAGRVVAYLATQQANQRTDGSTRPRRILEIAGNRDAIVEAATLVADELLVPAYDSNTIGLCGNRGWVRTARQFLVTAEALTADVPVIPWYGLNYL